MRSKKIILCFVPYYLPGFKSGGVARSVKNFVENFGDEFNIKIICNDRDINSINSYKKVRIDQWNKVGKAQVFYASKKTISFFGLINFLKINSFDIVLLNSFFSPGFTVLPLILRLFGFFKNKKCIISTRGELTQGALRIKKLKKFFFIILLKKILYFELYWQVSSKYELLDIKKNIGNIAKNKYIFTDFISENSLLHDNLKRSKNKKLRIIFLSRISPIKNLHFLINVLSSITKPLDFSIYGNKEDFNYWIHCKKLCAKLPSNINIFFGKEINYKKVCEFFKRNDLFVFPSKGENFGHVVAESLSVGTCVIVSDKTPWKTKFPAIKAISLKKKLWISEINKWMNLKNKDFEKRRYLAIKQFLIIKKQNLRIKKKLKNLIYDLIPNEI